MVEELSPETIEAIFEALPAEVSFVDEADIVRFFNKRMDRIFPRPETILGRKVQDCHPSKIVHMVNRVLDDFKNDSRKEATFWINLRGRKVLIQYFPVRNKNGTYLGCLEVTQDITTIQTMQGEKRWLDD